MIRPERKTLVTALVLLSSSFVILTIAFGFRGLSGIPSRNQAVDTVIINKPFRLPDTVTFAGERLPLENFDTRESLERELLTSAFRHSSTILIIKRANRYLPIIEKILKDNGIPDDFKYLVAAESDYSNMISPVGATGFWQIMPETGRNRAWR